MRMEHTSCDGCRHDLGGAYNNCAANLESECAAGGHEAWEAPEPAPAARRTNRKMLIEYLDRMTADQMDWVLLGNGHFHLSTGCDAAKCAICMREGRCGDECPAATDDGDCIYSDCTKWLREEADTRIFSECVAWPVDLAWMMEVKRRCRNA